MMRNKLLRHAAITAVCASVLGMAAPMPALAWTAWNRHKVNDLGQGVFEVVGRVGSGPQQYWCGAGDYVRRALGMPAAQRVYIWRPLGPSASQPGKKAVQFALSPPKGASTEVGLSLSVARAGDNLSASMAQSYCHTSDFDERPPRLRP